MADDVRIGVVRVVPIAVAQHGDAGTASRVVTVHDRPADERRDAERREEVAAHVCPADAARFAGVGEVELVVAERERAAEHVLIVADGFPERIGERVAALRARQGDELVGVTHRERLEHHRVEDAEDRGVRTDPERQREDGDEGERRGRAERPQRVAHVADHRVEPGEEVALAGAFLLICAIAEPSSRFALGVFSGHAVCDEIVGALIDVKRHLAVDLARDGV